MTHEETGNLLRERYEPLEVVGSGGQGEVVRARDHQHERQVALKIRPAGDPENRKMLLSEARILLGLRPHPGLPLVRDDFFVDDRYVVVMDWVEGTDLRALLDDQGDPGLPVGSVLSYLKDVADALDHLHSHEPPIVHGDVKPGNMILTPQGRVILVDFGIATGDGERHLGSGTRGFVAPEVAAASDPTPAADIFGLAATAFALLTGASPESEWPDWEGMAPAQARSLGRAIRQGLSVDPARRPRRASELLERLGSWQEASLPTGVVTFLMTDVEDSTALWDAHPDVMSSVLTRHESIIADAVEANGGRFVKSRGEGDSTLSAFVQASGAVTAAVAMQRGLQAERWPQGVEMRVRAAIHTGEAQIREGDYYGGPLNRTARLRGLASGGQVLLSQTTAQLVTDTLPTNAALADIGSHELKGLTRAEQVFQLCHPDLPGDAPDTREAPVDPASEPRHNLPASLTKFIGREADLDDLERLLSDTRVLTLTGAGGCGKTRLALELGMRVVSSFQDGVWFVDLAPVGDEALVANAVASALVMREVPNEPITQTIKRRLGECRLLLVLDNCEHMVSACASFTTEIALACPSVTVLTTSREPLGIAGETAWQVTSLSYPDPSDSFDSLQEHDAVRLFSDRAAKARPKFRLSEENAGAVATICRRLDGIPLALELAAARMRVLAPEQIADGLSDSFRLLGDGGRGAVGRQRTLEGSVDWSYRLLSVEERTMLDRLSVFAGGFTLEAAEAVCADGAIVTQEVIWLLTTLADKSLVQIEDDGRYRLLGTIRDFARRRLVDSGQDAPTRDRHLDYFLSEAERIEADLEGGTLVIPALEYFEAELDNFRSSIEWALNRPDPDKACVLTGALHSFWGELGHANEGATLHTAALALPATPAARLKALVGYGDLETNRGNLTAAEESANEAIAIARELGDRRTEAQALGVLGWSRSMQDPGRAGAFLKEVLAFNREIGAPYMVGESLIAAANFESFFGEPREAHRLSQEAREIADAMGNPLLQVHALLFLGDALHHLGELEASESALLGCLDAARRLRNPFWIALSLAGVGWLAALRGDDDMAEPSLLEALNVGRDNNPYATTVASKHLTELALARGDLAKARGHIQEAIEVYGRVQRASWVPATILLGDIAEREGDRTAARASWDLASRGGAEFEGLSVQARLLRSEARAASWSGELDRSRQLLSEALDACLRYEYRLDVVDTLEALASLTAEMELWADAARLLGAAEAERAATGYVARLRGTEEEERLRAQLLEHLGPPELERLLTEGRATSIGDFVAQASSDVTD